MRHPLPGLIRRLTVRRIVRQKVRTLLTIAGVALGVAVVVAIEISNQSSLGSVDRLVQGVAGDADLQVRGRGEGIAASLLASLEDLSGVAAAYPIVEAPSRRPGADRSLLVIGTDVTRDLARRPWRIDGGTREADPMRLLTNPDRVLLAPALVEEEGLAPDDTVRITTAYGVRAFVVEGVLEGEGTGRILGGRTVWMDVAAAAAWFGGPDRLSHIDLRLQEGTDPVRVSEQIEARWPQTSVGTPAGRASQMREILTAFQANLRVVSLVALFVGTFLVLNTMITAVVQQRRELGLLKALGLERRRVLGLVATEAALLGIVGSAAGALLGIGMARAVVGLTAQTVSRVYLLVDPSEVVVPLWLPAAAFVVGVAAATAAALLPAFEAARIPPAQTIRRPPSTGRSRSRLIRLSLAALPAAAAVVILSRWRPTGRVPVAGYAAGLLVLVTAALLAPAVTAAAGRSVRPLLQRLGGIMGRLGADNLGRHLGRTSLAVTALATGISLVICVGAMIHSFKGSIHQWVDASINSDIVLTAGARYTGPMNVPLPAAFADSLASLAGVRYVNTFRLVDARYDSRSFGLASLDLERWQRDNPLRFVEGGPVERPAPGQAIVSQNFQSRFGIGAGDTLTLASPTGPVPVRVFGVILDFTADRGALFLDSSAFRARWQDERVDTFDVFVRDGVSPAVVQQEIEQRWGRSRDLFTMRHDELRKEILADVDATFGVVYGMEAIAALIALLGVVTTLAAAAVDRRRELAILRAVGTTRRQLSASVVWEAAILGAAGGVLGLLAGVGLSWVLIYVIQFQSTGWVFSYLFPWFLAGVTMVLAVAASAVSGLYPARLAADTDLLAALEYE